MNPLRTWLANVVTGGRYGAAQRDSLRADGVIAALRANLTRAYEHQAHLKHALAEIATMETEKANATVKRMAARAREALK